MMSKILDWFRAHEIITLAFLVILFICIRLPGVHLPLHQDEYKWPLITNPASAGNNSIPHPPLSEFIYRTAGYVVGFNVNFRFVPLFFGTLNLLLLYYFVRMVFDRRTAVTTSFIWIFSYFSVLASLMVDTDGEIMPFFFLLALIAYYKIKTHAEKNVLWWGILVLACIGGFFIKVSFLLAIGAIVFDFLWSKKNILTPKQWMTYALYGVFGVCILALLLILAHTIFPFFDLHSSLSYWEHFFVLHRDWFQTAIQCIKALLYTSPFLVCIPLMGKKEDFVQVRSFIFFLIFAFIFYIVLFDFSLGALDRYLQLGILPLTVFSAVVISSIFKEENNRVKKFFWYGITTSLIFFCTQFISHYVPALHPKSLWISRVLSLKWNFVYPFSGGSGPLGFYVSFLFMALAWIISLTLVLFGKIKPNYTACVLAFLIPVGIIYNGLFIEEYLVGYFNGSAPKLLAHAVEFIKNDSDIKSVTVYNDNGGNEIQAIGKYDKRLYVDPKFDVVEKTKTLNTHKEHYFVLDVPRIDLTSVYVKYFNSCKVVYKEIDQKMSATIYDCRKAPNVTL